jgi:hypothetical protein
MVNALSGALRSNARCLGLWATTLAIFVVDTLTELDIAPWAHAPLTGCAGLH